MSQYIYGVDFGTTNSALAILNTETNEIVKVFTTPSLLFFPAFQSFRTTFEYTIGQAAIDKYLESQMEGRFMKSIKRVLPNQSFTKTKIGGKFFKAEDLVALIISSLKKQADEFLGQDIKTAVIGRPVVFDEKEEKDQLAQKRLSNAVKQSGFEQFYFQMEPIAAAFTYERKLQKDELVLVGDFGGGTSDFTLMGLSPNSINKPNRQEDMISKGGIYIGGDNFDSSIMWHKGTPHFGRGVKEKFGRDKWFELPLSYFRNICSWEKMNFLNSIKMLESIKRSYVFSERNPKVKNLLTLVEKNLGYTMFREVEKTKIALTQTDETTLEFKKENIDISEPVSIEEFKSTIISKDLGRIEDYLETYLQNNKVNYQDIDTVFMTGGTSMVRPLKEIFDQKFGPEKIKSGDNFNSVAMGLAYCYPVVSKAS